MSTITSIAVLLAVLFTTTNAIPYSKYGRTCQDIGCRSDEVCVMAEDPCNGERSNYCGRYPTCQKSGNGGESCSTKMCQTGQYCKHENGRPVCVTSSGLAYDSAGVSSVNGQRLPTNNQPSVPANPSDSSRYANSNPYANANAPPGESANHNQPIYANNNPGYPPYPTNNNNGYPAYPANNNGYPQYPPNNNRPSVDQYGYPIYPPSRSDNRYHNTYPQHNLPQHNTGWSNTYPNSIFRRNGASVNGLSMAILVGCFVLSVFRLRILKA